MPTGGNWLLIAAKLNLELALMLRRRESNLATADRDPIVSGQVVNRLTRRPVQPGQLSWTASADL
jgi:hypothetical protein